MLTRSVILPDDYALLDEFFRVCEKADTIDLDLHRHALKDQQTTDQFQIALDAENRVQGFARLHCSEVEGLTEGRYWYYLLPSAPNQALATDFLHWAEQQTLQQSAKNGHSCSRLSTGSRLDHPTRFEFLAANSFTRERYFFTMKLALDDIPPAPALPAGYTLRSATLADIEPYTALHNLSFQEHWNAPPISADELRAEKLEPEYRPDLDILAVASDGTLASFCTATIEPMKREGIEEIVGFIASLGTDPAHRSRGLGRALLLHNLHTLRELGMSKADISVDAANPTGALRLYEGVGFQTFETWLVYFKSLAI